MPDNTPPAETATNPAGTGETPATQPDVSAPANGANGNPPAATPEALQKQLADMQAALKKANGEAASHRKKLDAFEAEEQKRKDAALSETEKAAKRIAELEKAQADAQAEITAFKRRDEFRKAAGKLKLAWASPQAEEDAFALLGVAQANEPDMEALLKAATKERPYLLQAVAPPPDINSGKKPGDQPAITTETQQELAAVYGVKPEHFKLKVS